jgi:peptide/nickel transport system permease protein
MLRFFLRRAAFAVLLVVVASSAALVLTRLAPGDVTAELGALASAAEVRAVRAQLGLDRSIGAQWAFWVSRAVRADFGRSYLYNQPVRGLVARAALNTAVLAVSALVVATLLGVGLGVVTGRGGAIGAGSRWGGAIRAVSLLCVSVPPLVTSLLLVLIAARTGWFPVGGMSSTAAASMTWSAWLIDLGWHLLLPTLALALPIAALLERLQAQSMSEAVSQPFVAAGRARGLSHRQLVLRHAWRPSLRPVCALYGIVIGALLSGSFVVEYVTSWPGLGRLMYEALRARDIYLVAGCAAGGAVFLAVGSLISDLLLALADPRVRDTEAAP